MDNLIFELESPAAGLFGIDEGNCAGVTGDAPQHDKNQTNDFHAA